MRPPVLGSGHRFRTTDVLSRDDLGELWAGSDLLTEGPVRVRILDERLAPSDPQRLQQVGGRLRRLEWAAPSRHLARVIDYELRRAGGRPAFAVFAGSGEPLTLRLERSGPLETSAALELVADVAEALGAAHAARVVHGALTPSSVLVGTDGLVAVIDVGLGELLADFEARGRAPSRDVAERELGDVRATAELFERLIGLSPPAPRAETELPPWADEVPPEVASALRRALSPYRRLRPSMLELAAALAASRGASTDAPAVAAERPARLGALPAPPERIPEGAILVGTSSPRAPIVDEPELPPAARPRRRTAVVIALAAIALVAAGAGLLALRERQPGSPPPVASTTVEPSPTPTPTLLRATVPDALGLPLDEATELLESAGLIVGQVTDVPGGADVVVRSDPTPGEAVVAGTEVDLFVGDGSQT